MCTKAYLVKLVNTIDLKSVPNIRVIGSSPIVGILLFYQSGEIGKHITLRM